MVGRALTYRGLVDNILWGSIRYRLVAREIENGHVARTERVQVFHGEPPLFRRHGGIGCNF